MRQHAAAPLDTSELWRTLPLVDGIPPATAKALLDAARTREFAAGSMVFAEGHAASALFVVISGSVKLVQLTDAGEAVVFRLLGHGDVFGLVAVFGNELYPVSALTVTATSVLQWPVDVIRPFLEEHSRLSLNLLRSVSDRLQSLRRQYRQLATEKVEQRVARALLRLLQRVGTRVPDGVLLDLPLSREDVAQLTGTTVYSVSRIISRWEGAGLLRAGRQQLIIRQPEMLASIADDAG